MNKNELKILYLLADGEQHDEAPKGMTDAQFSVALKSLKARGLVYAAFEEGGGVVASQITLNGCAVLDDLLQREKEDLERQETIGRIKEEVASEDEKLVKVLEPFFYKNREEVIKYIGKMKTITSNTEKARYTAELVNQKKISDIRCKSALHKVLHDNGLYHPGSNNWIKSIKNYLAVKKVEKFQ